MDSAILISEMLVIMSLAFLASILWSLLNYRNPYSLTSQTWINWFDYSYLIQFYCNIAMPMRQKKVVQQILKPLIIKMIITTHFYFIWNTQFTMRFELWILISDSEPLLNYPKPKTYNIYIVYKHNHTKLKAFWSRFFFFFHIQIIIHFIYFFSSTYLLFVSHGTFPEDSYLCARFFLQSLQGVSSWPKQFTYKIKLKAQERNNNNTSNHYDTIHDLERYWVRVLACAKLQRERIDCTSVYLFLYGESSVKISTQTDSY